MSVAFTAEERRVLMQHGMNADDDEIKFMGPPQQKALKAWCAHKIDEAAAGQDTP